MLYTEADVRKSRIRYNLEQLDEAQVAFCKSEARRLQMMGLNVPDNSLDDCIAEDLRIRNDFHRAQYCAQMDE